MVRCKTCQRTFRCARTKTHHWQHQQCFNCHFLGISQHTSHWYKNKDLRKRQPEIPLKISQPAEPMMIKFTRLITMAQVPTEDQIKLVNMK